MPIIFHEHTKQFHLFNSQVSYIICIMENGQIENLYYGKALRDREDFSHFHEELMRSQMSICVPGLSTLAIYNGVNVWNEFSFAYTLTQSAANRTLPLAVWDFQGQYSMNTPMIMAVLTLTVLPMIILFIFAQDKLVKGMTAGAVKG